jgi:hypothetical protein
VTLKKSKINLDNDIKYISEAEDLKSLQNITGAAQFVMYFV